MERGRGFTLVELLVVLSIMAVLSLILANVTCATEPPITALAFAPDGDSVVVASQSGLQVLDWPALKPRRTIKVSASNLHCLAFSPPGNQLAVGGGNPAETGMVEIFSWPAGESVTTVREHDDSVLAVAWPDAATLISASFDRDIKLFDTKTGTVRASFNGHSRGVSTLCVLTNAKMLVSAGDDQSLRVWNLESGELVRSLNQHTKPIHALALRPARGGLPMVATAAGDRTVRFWQPTIGRMVRYVRLQVEPLNIAWLNDGSRIVAACTDGHVRVIDADKVQVNQDIAAISGWAYAIAAHPSDGSVVVGGVDHEIRRIMPDAARREP